MSRRTTDTPRGRRLRHEVTNMPPPWRRSLTESGMTRRATHADGVIVAVFFVAFATVATLLSVLF